MDLMVAAALGWVVAAFAVGLWWGERHSRLRAERLLMTGAFERKQATVVPPPPDAEYRVIQSATRAERELSEEAVKRGTEALRKMYSSNGLPVPPDNELRLEAEALLMGEGPV